MMRAAFSIGFLALFAACSSGGGGGGAATGGAAGTSSGGTAGTAAGGSSGAGTGGGITGGSGGGTSCTSARNALLNPVDKVSTGDVEILEQLPSSTVILVNASAGGFNQAAANPYVYLKLSDTTKLDITDPAAFESSEWDVALKRDVIRTNSADSGPGQGGAFRVSGKTFDQVTIGDAGSLDHDDFLDDACNAQVDATGKPLTAFSDWYDYNEATMYVSPKLLVWIVQAANGSSFYKLVILDYYALADGGTGTAGAYYRIRVAAL
jgi:hypothetical protein